MSEHDPESAIELSAARGETRAIDDGTVLETFLQEKYERDPDEEDRWTQEEGVYHSGQIPNCPRAWFWTWNAEGDGVSDPSSYPYFELGNTIEDRYGEALATIYGEERIRQDVEVQIEVVSPSGDDVTIVGECDWCLLREDLDPEYGLWYVVYPDGRRVEYQHFPTEEENPDLEDLDLYNTRDLGPQEPALVETVIETKTTAEVEKKQKYGALPQHERQLTTYLHGTGVVDGKIVYIERDNLAEYVVDVPYEEEVWLDNKFRAVRHHENLKEDLVPATDPIDKTQCWYCDHRERCNKYDGGSEWS